MLDVGRLSYLRGPVPPICLTFKYTFLEAYRGMFEYIRCTPSQLLLLSVFPAVGLVILVLILLHGSEHLALGVLAIFMCFSSPPILVALLLWSGRRRNRLVDGLQSVTLTEDFVRLAGPLHSSEIDWAALQRAKESDNYFFLYVTSQAALIIPKKAVSDCDQLSAIRALIASRLGTRAALRHSL